MADYACAATRSVFTGAQRSDESGERTVRQAFERSRTLWPSTTHARLMD
jgi:hypothetical protein